MKRLATCFILCFLVCLTLGSHRSSAQECPDYYEVDVYESVCVMMCGFDYVAVGMIVPDHSLPPVYVIQKGCSPADTPCEDPTCRAPSDYCFDALVDILHFGHLIGDTAAYWEVEIYNYLCPNDTFCLCFTFERVLPVELTAFAAIAGDEEVRLNWTTASEMENDRWIIDRATSENGPWITIHEEPGQGTINTVTHYGYNDRTVQNGMTYWYRLTDVSVLGARHSHPAVNATPGSLSDGVPSEFVLKQNFPNPFNPTTTFEFALPQEGFTTLKVFDLLGREVATVVEGQMEARWYQVTWNASNLASGVYLYTLNTSGFSGTRKLLLMK
ncbi:MAG: T9SS type A sorting domain-containing protein [bacterium]